MPADLTKPLSPWNPSFKATLRVKNPLPVPEECPHCGSNCGIVNNSKIYGSEYGEWPWAVFCPGCRSYVGLHPFTGIPVGTLATREMRAARSQAKPLFNILWEAKHMTRTEAYSWLAKKLGIPEDQCHFGLFDVERCQKAIEILRSWQDEFLQRRYRAKNPSGFQGKRKV